MHKLDSKEFVTWNEPIEMLYACHDKVKQFCYHLQLLPNYLAQHGTNQAVKNDVQQILNYFNQAAPLHHDDEEKDFFPALMKHLPSVQSSVETLEEQHEYLHQNWAELSIQLEDLIAEKRDDIDPDLIKMFIAGYDQHIEIEEPLFELGREHLAESELQEIGKIMAKRRKV